MKHPLLPDKPLSSQGHASQTALPNPFRVLVWNCHKGTYPHWHTEFFKYCQQTDLMLMQEMCLTPNTQQLLQQSKLIWHTVAGFVSPLKNFHTGVSVGCRADAQEITYNASIKEPLLYLPKITLGLTYPLGQTRILVCNLHAINFTGLKPFERTLQNAAELVNRFTGPVLWAGDFNTWSQKRIRILYDITRQLGLTEVTFTPDIRTRYLHHPVDYLFIRGLEVLQAQVLPCHTSDHQPLTATLLLPGATSNNMVK